MRIFERVVPSYDCLLTCGRDVGLAGYNHAAEYYKAIAIVDLGKVKAKKSSKHLLQAGLAKLG